MPHEKHKKQHKQKQKNLIMKQNSPKIDKIQFSRHNPLISTIKKRVLLNKEGSSKNVFHIELDLSQIPLQYNTGDCVAILPQNPTKDIELILSFFEIKEDIKLIKSLIHDCNIVKATKKLLQLTYDHSQDPFLKKVLTTYTPKERKSFLESIDVPTLLETYKPINMKPSEFLATLQPMLPKFYSIASSYLADQQSISLMISTFVYSIGEKTKEGLCSSFLCNHASIGETNISFYLQPNPHFSLPKSTSTPIIMVGPGTGFAPFRGFIQERVHNSDHSVNWLFTGDRHSAFDFYYEDELRTYESNNNLNLVTAFSRDQEEKCYVHHKMQEHSKKLWSLIHQEGAHIYICGDAKHMAKDVTNTLYEIAQNHGNLSHEEALNYYKKLRSEARFVLDVY